VKTTIVALGVALFVSTAAFAQVPGGSSADSLSASFAGAAAGSTSNSNSKSNSSATGGNASSSAAGGLATGGSATGGNSSASTGPSSSTSSTGPSSATGGNSGAISAKSGASKAIAGSSVSSGGTSNVTLNSGGSGTSTDNIQYSGSYTVRDVPPVAPPGLYGGTNPCTVGVSGGLSVTGFGLGLGGTWSDRGCERRNGAVILFQANMPEVAVSLLCQDSDMRAAFLNAGKPCPQDRQAAAAQPAPVATSTPAPPPVAAMPAATMVSAPQPTGSYQGSLPEWCSQPSRTPSDQAAHNYYCH